MTPRWRHFLAMALTASVLMQAPAWAQELAAGEVRDLHFGEALFHFYQDDHFTSLSRLLMAQEAGRITHHRDDAELLAGGLYLQFGMYDEAERAFRKLLDERSDPALHDRVWFQLGRAHYRQGKHEAALGALQRVDGRLAGYAAAELPLLKAQSNMALGRYTSAAALLENWQGPADWLPFMRYNLGVALIRSGDEDAGIAQLEALGRTPARDAEDKALRDRANLALGYTWLQQSEPGRALEALQRVRLEGASANRALLGVGWARTAMDDHAGALVPWQTLWTRDRLDGAVQESLLAVPYALARLDADQQAVHAYERALAAFDDELRHLDDVMNAAKSGELVDALLLADDPERARWHWQLDELPVSSVSRYLHALIASHGFQQGLGHYRDLLALGRHLDEWHERLETFDHMVEAQMLAAQQRAPVIDARIEAIDVESLVARRDELAARLEDIARDRDVVGLGNDEELEFWKLLEELASGPALAAAPEQARERHRLLRGHLLWQMDRDYGYRLWQQQRALTELDGHLEEVAPRLQRVMEIRAARPQELEALAERIDALSPRIDVLRDQVALLRAEQAGVLTVMAMSWLEAQQQRLVAYQVQARFALATLYDRAATAARPAPVLEPGS